MVIVNIQGLSKEFVTQDSTTRAIDDLDLTLEHGEFVCLLGPSGCGKTTILRSIAGLETPTRGRIEINGETVFCSESGTYVPPERRGLGMVFQSYAVWPHMTVAENIAYPLKYGVGKLGRRQRDSIAERVDRMLEIMDCRHLANRYPSELSGGQQQRVALARTLVYEPDLLLFDEPLSNLDAKLRERMRLELRELQQRLGFAALYVTHDREEALTLSDRTLVMRSGVVVQSGSPEDIYDRPNDVFVADFIGPVNLLPVSRLRGQSSAVLAETPLGEVWCADSAVPVPESSDGAPEASVLIRPSSLTIDVVEPTCPNRWRARVISKAYLGEQRIYSVQAGDLPLTASTPAHVRIDADEVFVAAAPEACRIVRGQPADSGARTPVAKARSAVPA